MKSKLLSTLVLSLALSAVLFFGVASLPASADSNYVNFDSYVVGNINGQDGWTKTGAYDAAVVNNTYGYASFGTKTLRISDAVTTGGFGDQTYAKPLINAAGESGATDGGFSVGIRQKHYETQFDLASAVPGAQQPGMHISISPDRGNGSRMSYLRIEDVAAGLDVYFDDVVQAGPCTPSGCANFVETKIAANLNRAVPHTFKLTMDLLEGPGNDVVKVYIDGVLVKTGTSWEDYYRYDPEAAAEQSTRIVKTVLFRESGTQTPANSGKGYLIDNFSQTTSGAADTVVVVTPSNPNGWFFYDDAYPGGQGSFVTGPATPPRGTGSVRLYLPNDPSKTLANQPRQNITTLQYGGTRLSQMTKLEYSTYSAVMASSDDTIFLQFDIDYDATDALTNWQGRLVYLPYTASAITPGAWQTWDPRTQGSWYSSKQNAAPNGSGGLCALATPCTWAQVQSNWPNAGINAVTRGTHLRAGGPSPDYDGNADKLTIGVNTVNTTFDFEPGSTALVFVPNSAIVGVGGQTVIGINLNNVANLFGYQFQASYDSSKVSAVGYWADNFVPPFEFFDTSAPATKPWNADCTTTPGTCEFSVSHVAPQTSVTGSGPLAFIVLTGTNPGTFTMTFSNDILSDVNAAPISHVKNTASITVYGTTTVSGVVNLQGRASPITTGTVTLTDVDGNFPTLTTNFNAGSGAYSFSNVPVLPGGSNYQFDAAHSLYLGNQQTQLLTGPYVAATTTLRGGDATNDGLIDIGDLSCIGSAFGGAPTVCGVTGSSDINADGTVNILDLVLAGGNYGLATPRPW